MGVPRVVPGGITRQLAEKDVLVGLHVRDQMRTCLHQADGATRLWDHLCTYLAMCVLLLGAWQQVLLAALEAVRSLPAFAPLLPSTLAWCPDRVIFPLSLAVCSLLATISWDLNLQTSNLLLFGL